MDIHPASLKNSPTHRKALADKLSTHPVGEGLRGKGRKHRRAVAEAVEILNSNMNLHTRIYMFKKFHSLSLSLCKWKWTLIIRYAGSLFLTLCKTRQYGLHLLLHPVCCVLCVICSYTYLHFVGYVHFISN